MNDWIKFLKKFYNEKKEKDNSYSYKDAMKDAKKEYSKKGGASEKNKKSEKTEKRKTHKNKLRKSNKNRK